MNRDDGLTKGQLVFFIPQNFCSPAYKSGHGSSAILILLAKCAENA
jgi:hypothetical protein